MSVKDKIILHGSGEHARVVLDCLLEAGQEVIALFDPKYTQPLYGIHQRGTYDPEFEPAAKAIIAIGANQTRKKVAALTRHQFTNAIHSSAIVSSRVKIGIGTMVLHGTIIQALATIGNHVIINTGAQVDHDCVVGDFVHIAPGAVISGAVTIGEGTFIGAGAVVINGKKIGAWATVGAGAVVTEDVPDYAVVVGVPAKIIKYNPNH